MPDPEPFAGLPLDEPLVDLDDLAEATRAFVTADDPPTADNNGDATVMPPERR